MNSSIFIFQFKPLRKTLACKCSLLLFTLLKIFYSLLQKKEPIDLEIDSILRDNDKKNLWTNTILILHLK